MTDWGINKFNLTWEWWSCINGMLEIIVDLLDVRVFGEYQPQIGPNATTHIHKLLPSNGPLSVFNIFFMTRVGWLDIPLWKEIIEPRVCSLVFKNIHTKCPLKWNFSLKYALLQIVPD